MERRAFLKFVIAGAAAAASSDALALTSLPARAPSAAPSQPSAEAAVATPADLDLAKIEKTQWGYYWRPRRRYWRRRFYWRPRRRFWRRRRYYYY